MTARDPSKSEAQGLRDERQAQRRYTASLKRAAADAKAAAVDDSLPEIEREIAAEVSLALSKTEDAIIAAEKEPDAEKAKGTFWDWLLGKHAL